MKKLLLIIAFFSLFGGSASAQCWKDTTTIIVNLVGFQCDSITKKSNLPAGWNAGTRGNNVSQRLGNKRMTQATIIDANKTFAFGLSNTDTDYNYTSILYCIKIDSITTTAEVFKLGVSQNITTPYAQGDKFKIIREYGTILFVKNDSTIHIMLENSTSDLFSDVSLYGAGMSVEITSIVDIPTYPKVFWERKDTNDIQYSEGKVIIGDTSTTKPGDYMMYVQDGILAEKVRVAIPGTSKWSDWVFDEQYNLMPLEQVAQHIAEKKHLPNMFSAEEMVNNGLDIAETDAALLRQIEELWLHLIAQKKTSTEILERQDNVIEKQQNSIEKLKETIKLLEQENQILKTEK